MEISLYKHGSDINIKKSHRGLFTEYCEGEVTNEKILKAKQSNDPKIRKLAIFAENARKWKHAYGGSINGNSANPEGLKLLPKEKKSLPSEKDKLLPKEKKLPTALEREYVKLMLKKYPGLTELQAAGRAPIKMKGRNYVLRDGKIRRMSIGGLLGGAAMGFIQNKAGDMIGNLIGNKLGGNVAGIALGATLAINKNSNEYINKLKEGLNDSITQALVTNSTDLSKLLEQEYINNRENPYKVENPLSLDGVHMTLYQNASSYGNMSAKELNQSLTALNQIQSMQDALKKAEKDMEFNKGVNRFNIANDTEQAANYSKVAENINPKLLQGTSIKPNTSSVSNALEDKSNSMLKGVKLPWDKQNSLPSELAKPLITPVQGVSIVPQLTNKVETLSGLLTSNQLSPVSFKPWVSYNDYLAKLERHLALAGSKGVNYNGKYYTDSKSLYDAYVNDINSSYKNIYLDKTIPNNQKNNMNEEDYQNLLKKTLDFFTRNYKKGGNLPKAFGHYEDPTDDCGKVNPKTRKLVKRPKSYHRYNVGNKV